MRSGTIYRCELFRRIGVRASGARVLDIGAFDGYWLASQPGVTRVALDIDIRANANSGAVRGDGTCLPFPDDTFDSVFAFDVIEHVEDDRLFVSELVRVTRRGGRITLTTPSSALRIFPPPLTAWAHRRWGHDRRIGYERETLCKLFSLPKVEEVSVRELRCRMFLTFYLPLSVVGRVSHRLSSRVLAWAAAIDSRWTRGEGGFLLATVRV